MNPLQQINNPANANQTLQPTQQDALQRAARQFEAILLMQLTSALNGSDDGDENKLFGNDGGSNLAKQMFSEQLATVMAESGGIGLSDLIMQQLGANQTKPVSGNLKGLSGAIAAVREIKNNNSQNSLTDKSAEIVSNAANTRKMAAVLTGVETVLPKMAVSTSDSPTKTGFQMPVAGRISSGFGNRFHPIDKKIKFHGGIDIAVPRGTAVGAAAEGVVTFAGWKGGYGNLVIIQHADGRDTRYAHLDKIFVAEGDKVFAGQTMSLSGSTGKSTGPHLHFEVRENGRLVNPMDFLSNVLSKKADR